ncbi:MAG TPA: isoprenylcysteine carboxylmethyltransferase family protein [Terriglobales bacterium]|nr:isoprenylcysteine carboxylmethyltransferase family protein [Terriglobales bacterium]
MNTRHWTDWVGFAVFLACGIRVMVQVPEFGIFLLPALLHQFGVSLSFLLRRPVRAEARGWLPPLSAYASILMLPIFGLAAARWYPEWLARTPSSTQASVAGLLLLGGSTFQVWCIWHMRRAFSIVPQARMLVTNGPYRYVRHPIYAMIVVQNLAGFLFQPTGAVLIAHLAWLAITVVRVNYEEQVMRKAFPEYEEYARRVGAFLPRPPRQESPASMPLGAPADS